MLLLDTQGRVETFTAPAQNWLQDLGFAGEPDHDPLPFAVLAVAERVGATGRRAQRAHPRRIRTLGPGTRGAGHRRPGRTSVRRPRQRTLMTGSSKPQSRRCGTEPTARSRYP
jgi:hypothetical protein